MNRLKGLKNNYPKPQRLSFPKDEEETGWLSDLLDSYYTADRGIFELILKEERKGRRLACARGCSTCCSTHVTIPVYPMEILGIYWYVLLKLEKDMQKILKERLINHKDNDGCPFLIDGACFIHPMRPLACRHFNVFNTPCAPGEDPYYTRRKDVLTPDESTKNKALACLLSIHNINDRKEKKEFVRTGQIHTLAKNLQEIEWIRLGERIE
ncbi:MAG: YkgJ family cysteine cluster protein [Desulfobacteraceae bacterium]|nr:YkgJ family cysteine cluster protein [Desulfobacteraceae bacterium]MCB9494173.1 YkgJ family cysteine cluster protein [Desulfobacteraceae bacterium]